MEMPGRTRGKSYSNHFPDRKYSTIKSGKTVNSEKAGKAGKKTEKAGKTGKS